MIDHSLVTGFTMFIRRSFDMTCFGISTYHRHEPPLSSAPKTSCKTKSTARRFSQSPKHPKHPTHAHLNAQKSPVQPNRGEMAAFGRHGVRRQATAGDRRRPQASERERSEKATPLECADIKQHPESSRRLGASRPSEERRRWGR